MPNTDLTVKQLALKWQSRTPLVYSAIGSGALRAFDLSPNKRRRTWRIPLDAVLEYEAKNAATSPQKPAKKGRRKKKQADDFARARGTLEPQEISSQMVLAKCKKTFTPRDSGFPGVCRRVAIFAVNSRAG